MGNIITTICENGLLDLTQKELNKLKHRKELYFIGKDTKVYKNSKTIKIKNTNFFMKRSLRRPARAATKALIK